MLCRGLQEQAGRQAGRQDLERCGWGDRNERATLEEGGWGDGVGDDDGCAAGFQLWRPRAPSLAIANTPQQRAFSIVASPSVPHTPLSVLALPSTRDRDAVSQAYVGRISSTLIPYTQTRLLYSLTHCSFPPLRDTANPPITSGDRPNRYLGRPRGRRQHRITSTLCKGTTR